MKSIFQFFLTKSIYFLPIFDINIGYKNTSYYVDIFK
ncbi:hypothetical protein c7_L767 [Megavirus courdo7]|uniref:Uncharacterized protein n=1 Tax=Megavirus courdo7 TaxID=1128135 RepID=H2EBQ7_9VIRU|nr:hypothetical protein c7_L767 [Megavirus courdo7]